MRRLMFAIVLILSLVVCSGCISNDDVADNTLRSSRFSPITVPTFDR